MYVEKKSCLNAYNQMMDFEEKNVVKGENVGNQHFLFTP